MVKLLKQGLYTVEHYQELFSMLYTKHLKHTGKWLSGQKGLIQYNLKKIHVRSIMDINNEGSFNLNHKFFEYVINFRSELFYLYLDILKNGKKIFPVNFYGRVKAIDSIINKLHKKRNELDGSFPINKVLNDLLGFRIIDMNYEHNIKDVIKVLNYFKEVEGFRINHKERINGEYHGYHIYFMGKNAKYFPLELQLWDTNYEKTNLISHEKYKKDYTQWPIIYHNG